ncbi:MAG: hypothetical protein ACFCUN_02110 [Hyphomicrobiaceae bacterium]
MRHYQSWVGAARTRLLVGMAATFAAGCAVNTEGQPQFATSGLTCVEDTTECIAARRAAHMHLVADTSRSWVAARPSARHYVAGVRLFAFKTEAQRLACADLAVGVAEAQRTPAILRGPEGQSFKPGLVSRAIMLAEEVERELKREQRKRCGRR